jgi:glycine cleavage system aminomethyltransferase T
MRGDAAVVVGGGGIIGCSIAYHLTAAGCRDVVLLEKGELTSGTTLDKGDFVGRAALCRQRAEGPRRRLVPLVLDGEACVLWGGEAVIAEGRVAGRVRSGGYGHTIGRNVAVAYLPIELARPGTAVAVESFGQLVPAAIRTAPLWDPRGERVRA